MLHKVSSDFINYIPNFFIDFSIKFISDIDQLYQFYIYRIFNLPILSQSIYSNMSTNVHGKKNNLDSGVYNNCYTRFEVLRDLQCILDLLI